MNLTLDECYTARETFIRAYQEAASEPTNSRELCIRLALDAVWRAARMYQMQLKEAQQAHGVTEEVHT